MNHAKTIVVMPAYNAAKTLEQTINDIPLAYVDEIIFVDDASKDETIATVRELVKKYPHFTLSEDEYLHNPEKILFNIVQHEKNKGYGGNQKTCYTTALSHNADIIVMVHPDYQYDPRLVKYFVEFIRDGYFDVMLGSRIRSRKETLEGGMPGYKYYANRVLTLAQNIVSGRNLGEWHTGMRAYKKEVLQAIPFDTFSDDFIFDAQVLFSIVEHEYTIGDIPVPVRYFSEASSISFVRSVRYGLGVVNEIFRFVIRNSRSFWRYCTAGILAVFTNLSIYAYLLYQMPLHYTTAAFIAFFCGAVVSFTLQKFWTFKQYSLRSVPRELFRYVTVLGINAVLNVLLLVIFVQWFSFGTYIGNVCSNAIIALWSFFIYKHVTFSSVKL